jgi:hypothetical protein
VTAVDGYCYHQLLLLLLLLLLHCFDLAAWSVAALLRAHVTASNMMINDDDQLDKQ